MAFQDYYYKTGTGGVVPIVSQSDYENVSGAGFKPFRFSELQQVASPSDLAGLTESQIVRDPNSDAIYYGQGFAPKQLDTTNADQLGESPDNLDFVSPDGTIDTNEVLSMLKGGNFADLLQLNEESKIGTTQPILDERSKLISGEGGFMDIMKKLLGKAEEKSDLMEKLDMPGTFEALKNLNQQVASVTAGYEDSIIGEAGRNIPKPFVTGRVNKLRNQQIAEVSKLAATAQAMQNNLTLAKQYIDASLDLKYGPLKEQLAAVQSMLDVNMQNFTIAEQQRAETMKMILAERTRLLDVERVKEERIWDLGVLAGKNNAPADVLSKINEATSLSEAFKLAAPYMSTTEPVKIGEDEDGNSIYGTWNPNTNSFDQINFNWNNEANGTFRTQRHNNPIAFAVSAGGTNEFTDALDDAGIAWSHGDPFPDNPNMVTVRIDGDGADGIEAARAILSNTGAIENWYASDNYNHPEILRKAGVNSGSDFKKLDVLSQNALIQKLYDNENGVKTSNLFSQLAATNIQDAFQGAVDFISTNTQLSTDERKNNQELVEKYLANGDVAAAQQLVETMAIGSLGATQKNVMLETKRTMAVFEDIKRDIEEYEAAGGDMNIFTGNIEKIKNNLLGYTGDPELAKLTSKIGKNLISFITAASGVQFSDKERAYYQSLFPDTAKTKDLNFAKMQGLMETMAIQYATTLRQVMGPINYDTIYEMDTNAGIDYDAVAEMYGGTVVKQDTPYYLPEGYKEFNPYTGREVIPFDPTQFDYVPR